jgi:hypothetical protein
MIEDGDGAARKAALREQRRSLHEEDDILGADDLVDAGIGVGHVFIL